MTPTLAERSATAPASRVVAVLWAGFLTACLATMLFFACFDPQQLFDADPWPPWLADRRAGYALGFFFFWTLSSLAGALSAWLITPGLEQRRS